MFPERSIERHRRRPGREVSPNTSEHAGSAHWRILAAFGPVNSSLASLATADSSSALVTGLRQIGSRLHGSSRPAAVNAR
jgi:hypothetical protein